MNNQKLPDDLAKIRDELAQKHSPKPSVHNHSMLTANGIAKAERKSFKLGFNACAEIFLKREAKLRDRFENADEFAKRYAQATGELRGDNEYLKKQNIKLQARVSRLTEALKLLLSNFENPFCSCAKGNSIVGANALCRRCLAEQALEAEEQGK